MELVLIFQGSVQEERARHLQEDLNASREKYEKSLEEVQLVMKVLFVFASLRSIFISYNIPISTLIDCRERRENPKFAKRNSGREGTTRSKSTTGVNILQSWCSYQPITTLKALLNHFRPSTRKGKSLQKCRD